jgi:hypothetical protein
LKINENDTEDRKRESLLRIKEKVKEGERNRKEGIKRKRDR